MLASPTLWDLLALALGGVAFALTVPGAVRRWKFDRPAVRKAWAKDTVDRMIAEGRRSVETEASYRQRRIEQLIDAGASRVLAMAIVMPCRREGERAPISPVAIHPEHGSQA